MTKYCVLAVLFVFFLTGCQKETTTIIPAPQQPNVIVVPGRPQTPPPHPRPGIHIQTPGVDINVRPGYRWCNRCGVWIQTGHTHHCR